jgi:methylmalonyl-CoA mutase
MANETTAALLSEFPPVTTGQWEEVIRKDLKGADYNKRLLWQTDEGITVKPYYRGEDLKGLDVLLDARPGEFPYVRGTRADNNWRIREEIAEISLAGANQAARKALAAGAEEILFRRAAPQSLSDLRLLLDGLDSTPVYFWADAGAAALAKLLIESGVPLRGAMKLHPFTEADAAAFFLAGSPGPAFRPVAIRRASFLEAGATAVEEAAFMLAAGIDYLRHMTSRGVTVDQAANGVVFCFSVGSSYFMQIAKFRAFRLLWARAVESFGGSNEAAKAFLAARTADWNQSIYDPYSNVLRGTTEAMAAAIGGVDSLGVAPFDETYRNPDEASRRLARNTQTILKKEVWLDRVVDPAAGSYYVEVLTDSLARAAWRLMQEVESMGGYLTARDAGMIPNRVREARTKKESALTFRRKTIVGVNNYPNIRERMLQQIQTKDLELLYGRGAEMFEDIRLRTERHAAAGNKTPLILLAEMGDLKMRKARSAFMFNFFGCAGFDIQTQYFDGLEALAAGVDAADVVVLCSSDDEYSTLARAAPAMLKGIPLVVAGNPKDAEDLKRAGVADFVHIRSNAVETLIAWQERLGVRG